MNSYVNDQTLRHGCYVRMRDTEQERGNGRTKEDKKKKGKILGPENIEDATRRKWKN